MKLSNNYRTRDEAVQAIVQRQSREDKTSMVDLIDEQLMGRVHPPTLVSIILDLFNWDEEVREVVCGNEDLAQRLLLVKDNPAESVRLLYISFIVSRSFAEQVVNSAELMPEYYSPIVNVLLK